MPPTSAPPSPRTPSRLYCQLATIALAAAGALLWSPNSATVNAHTRITTDVTWDQDVRPILRRHCMRCHSPGGEAPSYVDLTTYGNDAKPGARAWAAAIEEEVLTGRMPPWSADHRYGRFANARTLTKDENDQLIAWVGGGAPQGPKRNLPSPSEFADRAWELGPPDLIVRPEADFILSDGTQTATQTLRFSSVTDRDTWITGYEFKPDQSGAVQRITAWIVDDQLEPEELEVEIQLPYDPFRDQKQPAPTRLRPTPSGRKFLGQYLPGDVPVLLPAGAGKRLRAGATIEIETVYRRRRSDLSSGEIRDRSSLGLYLAQTIEEVDLITETLHVGSRSLTPSKKELRKGPTVSATLTEDTRLIGLNPRFDPDLETVEVILTYPDGRRKTVLLILDNSADWPSSYQFERPLDTPKGTTVSVSATARERATRSAWSGDLELFVDYTLTDHLVLPFVVDPTASQRSSGGMLIGLDRLNRTDPSATTTDTTGTGPGTPAAQPATAHMDHSPLNGGQFFMAANQYHHLEGTLPKAGEFQLYFYDDFKRPIDPRNFASTVVFERFDQKSGDFTEESYPMSVEPGADYLVAAIPKELPAEFFAAAALAGQTLRFDFYFEETTKEPVNPPRGGGSAVSGTHTHYRPPLHLPTDTLGIVRELQLRVDQVEERMNRGDWRSLYVPAFDARDLAESLLERLDDFTARERGQVRKAVGRVMQSAAELDRAGDLADAGRARRALARMRSATREISSLR